MKNRVFGLDIGATSMKAVWLSHEQEGFFLQGSLTALTPQKGMLSESPIDQQEMADGIKKAIDEVKITAKEVNIALPENQVFTKIVEMPLLSDRELSSAIYWEAEQYIPVPLSNITLDYKVLKRPEKEGAKMEVLLVGAPTALIEKYQKIMFMAGLEISAIETEVLSAARALVVGESFPSTLIVHIGAVATSFAIVRQGLIVFTYSISLGGVAMNRAIATDFGLTMSQAEEYKKVYGIATTEVGNKISKASEPILMAILAEVKKSLAYYTDKYKDDPIAQIILSGGSAKLPGIDLFFAKNCGVETVVANPWKVLANQQIPKEIIDNAPEYTIAVGLALRDFYE